MLRRRHRASRGLRWSLLGVAAVVACTVISDPTEARARRKQAERAAPPAQLEPRYADIVVDANNGAVLHATNADALRHPASLTKVMTLYLLFERLEAGKLTLDSELDVSAHAAVQAPTKLGLREGQTLKVEDAIKGVVTRSANDAAVVIAENLAGGEEEFARLMTRKAQALGMTRTVYRNASGLPNDAQVTTARDQSILGRAIQDRFPRYYPYFSTRAFTFRGHAIASHNRLLGRLEGVDGIKTGYINASGFNIVTSVHRGNRYLVAAVFGGASAGSRDARMRDLIGEHITTASVRRTAPMVAELNSKGGPTVVEPKTAENKPAEKVVESKVAERRSAQGFAPASASSAPVRPEPVAMTPVPAPRAVTGSTEPIRPVPVKTLLVKPGSAVQTASIVPLHLPPAADPPNEAPAKAEPPIPTAPAAAPAPAPVRIATAPAVLPVPSPRPQVHSGWIIQVGAYPVETEAKQRLSLAKSKAAKLLAAADAFIESVVKGDATLYRARFAGLDKDRAEAACKFLKRNEVDCVTIRN